jgi:hypothetical protein
VEEKTPHRQKKLITLSHTNSQNLCADSMRSIKLFIFLLLIFSCKEKQNKATIKEPVTQPKGSISLQKDSVSLQNDQVSIIYLKRASLDLKNYSITIKSKFDIPETLKEDSSFYFNGIILYVHNKTNNTTDSVPLDIDNYSPSDLKIEDFSDSLHFKTLLLCITWRGDSDIPGSEFVECKGHSLKILFSIDNLETLERKDKWTLSGFVMDRDEVVEAGQRDYPVTVSLKDYEVHITEPGIQYIGYETRALNNIKAYRDPKLKEISAFIIKKGRELIIDTLYRSARLVRLIVSDSIILYARPDKISEKVQHNAAG